MPPRPAKRQRRLVILSSDNDDDWSRSAEHTDGNEGAKDHASTVVAKQINTDGTAVKRTLPTRSRTKSTVKKTRPEPFSIKNSTADPSPKKRAREPKPTAKLQTSKPISSFFNAAPTQSQPSNDQKRPKEESPNVEEGEEEDLIEDDSSNEGEDVNELRGLQDTTRLVLDRRKRLPLSTLNSTTSTQGQKLPAGSQRFKIGSRTTGEGADRSISTSAGVVHVDPRPWAERFEPRSLEELAVHKRKVSDIRNWLEKVLQGRDYKRLLILKGPSGAGKTATISTLAKAMDFELSEWRNPVGSELSSEGYQSMSAQFEEFLGRSSKFGGLELIDSIGDERAVSAPTSDSDGKSTRRKVILLEDFPNTFLSTSSILKAFRSSIVQFLATNTPSVGTMFSKEKGPLENITPVVMIITETRINSTTDANDSFTAHRLLGADVMSHPGVSTIDFNPIAPTLLTKALDLICQKEARHSGRRRLPGPSVLKRLSEVGDVRSATGSLEFLCIRGEDGDDPGGSIASGTKKGANTLSAVSKIEKQALEVATQRESSLGLFHAVGRVVYNKRSEFIRNDPHGESLVQPPNHMPEHARLRIPQVSVDQLINETGTDTSTFVAALHENYVMSCEGTNFIESLDGCLDALSDSDLLLSPRGPRFGDFGGRSFQGAASDSLRQDEIAFQLAVRGLLFALPDPVKRRAHPVPGNRGGKNDTYKMFYPTSARLSRQTEDIESIVDAWSKQFRAGIFSSTHYPFQSPAVKATSSDTEPVRSFLDCTKSELILERLPYITKIEQRNPSTNISQLERITQFHGISARDNDVSDAEDIDDAASTMQWTTDHPADGRPESSVATKGVGRGVKEPETLIMPVEEEAGRLWLSDDDIVDD